MRKDVGRTRVTLESFLKNVMPEPNTGCWLWIGSIKEKSGGHGRVFYKNLNLFTAHRASYYFYNGDIPEGMSVLHKCDVPSCVNPEHLYLGTQQQNVKDRDDRNRGRWHSGEQNGRATITKDAVIEIRNNYVPRKYGYREAMANKFGVKRCVIDDILSGRSWKTV